MIDDAERQRILDEAFANIARRDAAERELAERQERNSAIGGFQSDHDRELARLERTRASMPPSPEPKLDTYSPDWGTFIDTRIAAALGEALSIERSTIIEAVAEALGLEGRDLDRSLAAMRHSHDTLRTRVHRLAREVEDKQAEIERLKKYIVTVDTAVAELTGSYGGDGVVAINQHRRYGAA